MGRKQAVDFSNTTLRTWVREIPSDAFEIKRQEKLIVIEKTAAIQFGGLDDSDTVKKFNSGEYAIGWLDQPDECTRQDVGMLRGTMRFKRQTTTTLRLLQHTRRSICCLQTFQRSSL